MSKVRQRRVGIVKGMSHLDMRSIWWPKLNRKAARKIRKTGHGPAGPSELAVKRVARQADTWLANFSALPKPVVQKVVHPDAPGVEGVIISNSKRDAKNARRRVLAAIKRAARLSESDLKETS
jgi:hypothetical protein